MREIPNYVAMSREELEATGESFWLKPYKDMTAEEESQVQAILIRKLTMSTEAGCLAASFATKEFSDKHYKTFVDLERKGAFKNEGGSRAA